MEFQEIRSLQEAYAAVYEDEQQFDGEQLQELSNRKLRDYIKKSDKSHKEINKKWDQGTATEKEKLKSIGHEIGQERAFKKLNKEEFDDIQESEGSYGKTPKAREAMGKLAISRREKPASEYSKKGEKTKKVKEIEKHTRRIDNGPDVGNRGKKSTKPRHSGFLGKSGRGKLDQDSRDHARDSAVEYTAGGHKPGSGTVTKNPKKLRKQKAMGEIAKEDFRVEYETFLEEFIDFNDPELDTLTFEELEEICTEALLELDEELLTEALNIIDGMTLLSEDRYADAVAKSKENAKNPEVKAGVRNLRKEKVKAALKSAASSIKKGATKVGEKAGSAVGKAANVASATKSAVKSGGAAVGSAASKAGSAVGSAASKVGSAASKAASGAKKVAKGAGEVAGAAAGGFRKGYADARGKSSGSTGSSTSGGSSGTMSSSEVGKKTTSSSEGESRVRLRDKIKSGIKKAVGSVARKVSRGARNVARRLGEQKYSWRTEMGIEQ